MEPGEVELKGLPGDYYTLEAGELTCSSGRQLDWFIGSPALVGNVEVWVDADGARAHRAVFCRVLLELDGDLGSRARRPQAFRGLTKEESRKAHRDEGHCNVGKGDLDGKWRRWNEQAESYLKRKEGVVGRKYSGRGCVGREVSNTMSAPQERGEGVPLELRPRPGGTGLPGLENLRDSRPWAGPQMARSKEWVTSEQRLESTVLVSLRSFRRSMILMSVS